MIVYFLQKAAFLDLIQDGRFQKAAQKHRVNRPSKSAAGQSEDERQEKKTAGLSCEGWFLLSRENGLGTLAIGRSTFERLMTVDQLAEVSLIGSPEEICRTVRAYADAGVSHFEIKFIYSTLERHLQMLQLFAREILPAFR